MLYQTKGTYPTLNLVCVGTYVVTGFPSSITLLLCLVRWIKNPFERSFVRVTILSDKIFVTGVKGIGKLKREYFS